MSSLLTIFKAGVDLCLMGRPVEKLLADTVITIADEAWKNYRKQVKTMVAEQVSKARREIAGEPEDFDRLTGFIMTILEETELSLEEFCAKYKDPEALFNLVKDKRAANYSAGEPEDAGLYYLADYVLPGVLKKLADQMIHEKRDEIAADTLTAALAANEKLDELKKVVGHTDAQGIPFLLTNPPAAVDEEHFLCREKDEEEVIRLLWEKRHLLLMNGVGGIGKSTLARKVFHRIKGEYAHAAWVNCRGNLEDDLLADFSIFRQEHEDEQSRELRLQKIMDFLKQPGKKLLVVDNANQYDEMLRTLSGFGDTLDILVTSRMQALSSYEPYHLEYLSKEACRSVFYCYCEALSEGEEQETVDKLIGLVQYHTLGTELLAKSLGFGDDPKEFYQNLLDKGFGFPDLRVEGDYLRDRGEETAKTMAEHLKILFDLQGRNEEEVRILQNLALMPTMPIPAQVKNWIKADPNALQSLVKSGWLDYDKDSKTYYLHPILHETVLLDEIPGSIGAEFFDCLYRKEFIRDDEPWDKALPKLDIAAAVLDGYTGGENRRFTEAGNDLAELYWKRGLYNKAIPIFERCIQIENVAAEPDQQAVAALNNNIANIFHSMGRLEEALEYSKKDQEILKKILDEDHPDLATSYNNIATIYLDMGRLEEALEYSQKALEIKKKVLGADHPDLATSYNNIATIYFSLGRLEEALEYSEKALAIREKVLGADHPSLATSYNNIATIYQDMGRLGEALDYSKKAVAIWEKVLGKNHPNTATAYGNIATIYAAMGNKEKALEYLVKYLAAGGKQPE